MDKFTRYESDWRMTAERNQSLFDILRLEFSTSPFTLEQAAALNKQLDENKKVRGLAKALNELCENNKLKPISKAGFRYYQIIES